jgi:phenylacetate-CoA ligase
VLFPIHERMKGHDTVAVHNRLEDSQWWSVPRLREYQLMRLNAFLQAVRQRVPYYRRLFSAWGIDDIASLSELSRIPLVTKSIMRSHLAEMKADGATGLARCTTGGSSGEPLMFFLGKERVSHDVAAKWRATRWWGVDIGDPEAVLWGSPIELRAQDRLRTIRDRVLRSRLLPAFQMSDAGLDRMISQLRSQRPRMLFGYPSALSRLACHADKAGVRMDDLGIRVAFATGETLYEDQRGRIGRTFACRVANGYGGRDAGFIAHECPEGGMHIAAEDVIVEIVDSQGQLVEPGHPGQIVVTHLATQDFPFLRYATGDFGVLSANACRCGRGLPLLAEIQGRATDFVIAQDGTVLHALALIYVIRELPGIDAFKIVQESTSHTVVLIVPGIAFGTDSIARITDGIKARLGRATEVSVELVREIPPEPSGKYRYVQSRVVPRG